MNTKFDYDIVFCQLPPMALDRIYSAPPVLKGIVQSLGYKSQCFDFNMTFFEFCNRDTALFSKLSSYFILAKVSLNDKEQSIISRFLDHIVETIVNANSQYIGMSVFSYYTHKITAEVLSRLQDLGLTDRVLLGGRGLSTTPNISVIGMLDITKDELNFKFFEVVKSKGLAKHIIIGDGEDAIVEFLKNGNIATSQFEVQEMPMHWPDYSDYQFDNYRWVNGIQALDITGSNGCVRNCDFCDVRSQFGQYKFLPGQDLAKQMIHFQQVYKINKFILTDSLCNGGLKHFKEFTKCLAEHNATADVPIIWTGSYICRDLSTRKDIDEYYSLIKLSGGEGLTIGAESGSNHVLEASDKKSSVEALFFELEKFRQHGITCQLLTFCGHWSERHEDFVAHCQMLINLVPYTRSGTVSALNLGNIYVLYTGTPAGRNINNIVSPSNGDMWISRINRGNTFKVRAQRRLILSKLAQILDHGVLLEESHILQRLISNVENHWEEFNQFFPKYTSDNSQFDAIQDDDKFVNDMLSYKKSLNIKLKINASSCQNSSPDILIKLNNSVLWSGTAEHGVTDFDFCVQHTELKAHNNVFSIAMTNKDSNDTVVDSNGVIIEDKNVVFNELFIDNCDLLGDVEFCYNHLGTTGLWNNDPVDLTFDLPFISWYSTNSNKNKSNSHTDQRAEETQGSYTLEDSFEILANRIKKLVI